MISPVQPAIYKLDYDSKQGYRLVYYKPYFEVSGKNYGDIDKHVNIVWDAYVKSNHSVGVMLTGAAGSGKTRVAELLGNRAIDNNMAVVLVTDVPVKIDLIPFIDTLYNMVVIFDEFSKNFDANMQNKMLTMFSSVGGNKKLFIITENDRTTVSPFIRTRPGRVRYAMDYDRIKPEVIEEYCHDYNVDDGFKEEIYDIYSKAPKFTFDHLQAIVGEHLAHPEMSMEDLIEILNIDDLIKPPVWHLTKVEDLKNKDVKWKPIDPVSFTKLNINSPNFRLWVDIVEVKETNEDNNGYGGNRVAFKLTLDELAKIENDETYIFEDDNIKFVFEKRD